MELSKAESEKIARLLTEKGATKACHRCGHAAFTVIDGYSIFGIQENLSQGLVIGGPNVPVAMVACNNCGAITPHALGAIGLLPSEVKG
jgi:hypothetical protein